MTKSGRHKKGDRVKVVEGPPEAPARSAGEVVEVLEADALYPDPPQYSFRAARTLPAGGRKKTKYPPGSAVYRVLVDGEERPRNFHESQLV